MAESTWVKTYCEYGKNKWNSLRSDFILEKRTLCIGVFQQLISFGLYIGDTDLAIVACRLYKDALAPSTKSSYSTGVNHLRKFTAKYDKIPFPADDFKPPSRLSISLIFFAAYLFEKDTIRSHSTIRNYMSQAKQHYLKRGYPLILTNFPIFYFCKF